MVVSTTTPAGLTAPHPSGVSWCGWVAQVVEKKEWDQIDWRRHAMFCGFGFAYLVGAALLRIAPRVHRLRQAAA